MTFAGDVPEGCRAQLMRANKDRLVDGAMEAALRCGAARRQGSPVLAIAISCVGRRLVLGERTEEEIEATLEVLPTGSELVGFYSYGEIAPHGEGVLRPPQPDDDAHHHRRGRPVNDREHRVLQRQMRRLGLSPAAPPEPDQWEEFLSRVSAAYTEADDDRYLLERSLEISGTEMQRLYEELRQASASALAAEHARLLAVTEHSPIAIVEADDEGRVLFENQLARDMAGGRSLMGPGRDLRSTVHHADLPALLEASAAAAQDGVYRTVLVRLVQPDGGVRWARLRLRARCATPTARDGSSPPPTSPTRSRREPRAIASRRSSRPPPTWSRCSRRAASSSTSTASVATTSVSAARTSSVAGRCSSCSIR